MRKSIAFRSGLFVVLSLFVLSSCGSSSASSIVTPKSSTSTAASSGSGKGSNGGGRSLGWIVAASGIEKMFHAGGKGLATTYFDNPSSFILGHGAGLGGWKATFVGVVTQVSELQNLVNSSSYASSSSQPVRAFLYDPEHWSFTPLSEQLSLATATADAQAIASKTKLKLLVAPAMDLTKVLAPGQPSEQAYLGLNIAGRLAPHAYAIDIQAQSLEANPVKYSAFVHQAAAQAVAGNTSIKIYAGLSTNPTGHHVTASQLYQDVVQTRGVVSGYWLNIPGKGSKCPSCGVAQPQIAIQLLQMLANSGIS